MPDPLPRFNNFQDWYRYVESKTEPGIGESPGKIIITGADLKKLRDNCYDDIVESRGRPVMVYAVHFVPNAPNQINLQDIDGFTDMLQSIPLKEKEVDVIIHSPGGQPDATERIVKQLRARFDKVHFLIPHSAYSAATMMAMSGDSITMHPSAVLGPIDPQLDGIPARQIKRAFENLQKKIQVEGEKAIVVYLPLIEKYSLHLLEMCDDSEKLSKKLVKEWLKNYMFEGKNSKKTSINITKAVNYMANFDTHLTHSRPLDPGRLAKYGIEVSTADKSLSALLWESHILHEGFFNLTGFVKLYETKKISWGHKNNSK